MYCTWICTERTCILPSLTYWVIYSVHLQHLHSWCLQRSRHTKGGEQWCFLQASEEQPMETPCEVTTWSPSEGCSWPRGMERPLNLKSRKQPGGKRDRDREREKVYNRRRHKTLGKTLYGHTFTGCKLINTTRIDTHKQTHWHTCRPTPSHTLMHVNTQTAWGYPVSMGFFLCRIFSQLISLLIWGSMRSNASFKKQICPSLFSHLLETKRLQHCWTRLWNVSVEFVSACLIYLQIIMLQAHSPYLLNFQTIFLLAIHSISFYQSREAATYRGSSGCVLREKSYQSSPRWGQ